MLRIDVLDQEWFDEEHGFFIPIKGTTLLLEHSLLSVSKWESKWKTSFLKSLENGQSAEQWVDYVRCMTINKGVDQSAYYNLTGSMRRKIDDYISDPMTATTITRKKKGRPGSSRIITSELIYAWMAGHGIPFECEKWHLNRLMTLIEVCAIEKGPQEMMSQADIMKQNAKLNAARKAGKHKTRGGRH